MNIVVNGQTEDCAPGASISRFLTERAYEAKSWRLPGGRWP
jgi:hypothetical protein